MLAFVEPDVLIERLRAEIDRIANTPCPLAQRERKIAELEGEIDRLMRIEESLIVATGANANRECLPAVVLGVKAVEGPGVRAAPERHWNHACNQRGGRHHNRPQSVFTTLENIFQSWKTMSRPQNLDVIDLKNRIFLDDPKQHQEAKRRVDNGKVFSGQQQGEQGKRHG